MHVIVVDTKAPAQEVFIHRVICRALEILEVLYWFSRRRVTLKQALRIIMGKSQIVYHDGWDEEEMWS